MFPDLETAREVLDGPILAELQAAHEAGGLKLFGYADSRFPRHDQQQGGPPDV